MAAATLDKGPVGPMVAALTILCLLIVDRKARWLGRLNWIWGLIILIAVCGPWAWAVTVATDAENSAQTGTLRVLSATDLSQVVSLGTIGNIAKLRRPAIRKPSAKTMA